MLQKIRHPVSSTLVSLREALGLNQGQFAKHILKGISKVTVARWETSAPPAGDTLLKLASIAQENNQREIADRFRVFYLDEVFGQIGNRLMVVPGAGYFIQKLSTPEEVAAAQQFTQLMFHLRRQTRGATEAIEALRKALPPRHSIAEQLDIQQQQVIAMEGKK